MSNFNYSPNMNLPVPIAGTDPGPDFALNVNNALTLVDSHDHSSGKGVPITPAGLNINADLTFLNNNGINLRSTRFSTQSSVLTAASDLRCLYVVTADLYFNDGNGNNVRITQSGGVAGSPGSIANLTSPASASYVSANSTFVWQSAANTPANLDAASMILRNLSANSHGLTINPPAAMASNISYTFPSIPASQSFVTLDASGNWATPIAYSGGITGTNLASNVNLPGKSVQANSQDVVVSANPATNGLMIVRGVVTAVGLTFTGEGATVGYSSSTGLYTITYSSAFLSGDTPVIHATPANSSAGAFGCLVVSSSNTAATLFVINTSTGAAISGSLPSCGTFHFIAIGQRA